MKIISFDPGYERLGVAVIGIGEDGERAGHGARGKETLLFSDCIITERALTHEKRLQKIGELVKKILTDWQPGELAAEQLFFNTNQKTALHVAEALGVVLYEAAQKNIPVFFYTPPQIKIATTGYGRSTKEQVTAMVQKLVAMKKQKVLDDEYDAVAIGLTHAASRQTRSARSYPHIH